MSATRILAQEPTAHADTFCADHLPPPGLRPQIDLSGIAELARYPSRFNCAAALLDDAVAAGAGPRTALYHPNGNWTYQELFAKSNQIAQVLVEDLGLAPGNRVLLRGSNHSMMAACWLGILKAGGVVVCAMPLLRTRELTFIADKAEIKFALCDARGLPDCEHAMQVRGDGSPRRGHILCYNGDHGKGSLEERMTSKPANFSNCDTSADDIAIIAFTSGTTGKSKGTMHSHRDILAITDCFPCHVLKPTADDIFCGSPPLAFTYALGGLLLFPLRFGAASVLVEHTTPPHLLQTIQEFRPTVCFTSPTGYRAMLKLLPEHDVSSLRRCVSAGEALPVATYEAWKDATGLQIIDGIGSTEMLHIFISAADDAIRPGSTGRAVPGYRAKLVDEDGNDLPAGQVGRLAVIGPTGCRYLDDPERQSSYVQHGWNLTGDSYVMDSDGYFWYQARTDDMIISSGYNISGPEVESILLEHPKVAECAVIGVPDEERGQLVKAYVVLSPDAIPNPELARELQDFVKSEIAPYKYPRAVEFVKALPRTETGKLQRFKLREKNACATDAPKHAQLIAPEGWARPIGFAHAVASQGRILHIAGQIGWDPVTAAFASDDLTEQTTQALRNICCIVRSAGGSPEHITRMTWYITQRAEYLASRRAIGAAYREILGRHYPAMSVVFVTALVEDRAKVEIEATAVLP